MGSIQTQLELCPALLVLTFVSGFLGGAATGAVYTAELTLQQRDSVFAQGNGLNDESNSIATSELEISHQILEVEPEVVSPAEPILQGIDPHRILIPAIGVEASVIDLGLNADGTLQVPESFSETGWWTGGARPGDRGAAVIVGHFDSKTSPAVFYRLRELQPGNEIQVTDAADQVVRFQVEQIQQVSKDAFPTDAVYGQTAESTLRLITCGGAFDSALSQYRNNVIVFASRIEG